MNTPNFELRHETLGAHTYALHLRGYLTFAAEAELMAAFNDSLEQGAERVVLDFSQLEYMNSTGIGLLVTLLVRARRSETQLAASGLNKNYQEIFHLTRLEEAFTIYPDLAAAAAV